MKKSLITLAAVALVSGAAFAQEADPSGQFALQIQGQRTRAQVVAEFLANRDEAAAMTAEDSGSIYLTKAGNARRADQRLAGRPVNAQ